jgi:hypothetical protein
MEETAIDVNALFNDYNNKLAAAFDVLAANSSLMRSESQILKEAAQACRDIQVSTDPVVNEPDAQ